jgi:Ser/Thr protein kinase RdoA (MazF antagonist)
MEAWLARQGWGEARMEPVAGGTNNSVFRLEGARGRALLKISRSKPDDPRDRFGAEKDFYDLLEKLALHGAPRRYAFHESLGAALYEWIEGSPVAGELGKEALGQAIDFLAAVQQGGKDGGARKASEACFSWAEHEELIERRLEGLGNQPEEIAVFVQRQLRPFWSETKAKLERAKAADFASAGGRRILSPGDFGFHNALRGEDGKIVFFDFEYSGWDDPAKTVADIFLQPERPVDLVHWDAFCEELRERAGLDRQFPGRASALLPLFGVKWACILLGSLSKRPEQPAGKIEAQVSKCRNVLGRVSVSGALSV